MDRDAFEDFFNELFFFKYEKDKVIYEQGDEGNFFYILSEGNVKAVTKTINPKTNEASIKEKIYKEWECFGELSLISQCKREETLSSLTDISFFTLDGESFREIQKRMNEIRLRDRYNFLNNISIFQPLGCIPKHNVTQKLKLREFKPNEKIISYGTVGETLYIIKNGLVSCRIGVKEIRKLGNNDYFGQNAILIDMKRACDVIALNTTTCYELSRDDLKDALGPKYIDVILFSFFSNCIDTSTYFKDIFTEEKKVLVFKAFKIVRYPYKERIASMNKTNKRLIMIIDGSILKEKDQESGYDLYARKGDLIGETFFQDPNSQLLNDLIAYPDCIAFEAEIEEICRILHLTLNISSTTMVTTISENKKTPLNVLNRISGTGFEPITVMIETNDYEVSNMSKGKHLKIIDNNTGMIFVKWNYGGSWNFDGTFKAIGTLEKAHYGRYDYMQLTIQDFMVDKEEEL